MDYKLEKSRPHEEIIFEMAQKRNKKQSDLEHYLDGVFDFLESVYGLSYKLEIQSNFYLLKKEKESGWVEEGMRLMWGNPKSGKE